MRLEYKYLVPMDRIEEFRKEILPYVDADDKCDENVEYKVRSIYFDTSDLRFYREKIEGLKIRKKLRIRGYNELKTKNLIFLEIKRKNEGFVNKNRAPLHYSNLNDLLESNSISEFIINDSNGELRKEDATKFLFHLKKNSLQPIVLVVYEREAYFSKFDDSLRITFDKNLRYQMYPHINDLFNDNLTTLFTDNFILEIKFSRGYPNWLSNIINDFYLKRKSLSKYTLCIDDAKTSFVLSRNSVTGFHQNIIEKKQ